MPKLDVRLRAVAQQIRCSTHVDIGSDHGRLLVALLRSGRIQRGIAIENNWQPYNNSRHALAGLDAEVRFGDGLEVLRPGEADSLSICGMGAASMVAILEAFPNCIPQRVILQPNRQPDLIRAWALRNGFHMIDEQIARGHWAYVALSFRRVSDRNTQTHDPAYENVDLEAALLFGPLSLKRRDPRFVEELREERDYLGGFDRLRPEQIERLALLRKMLATMTQHV